MTRTALRATAIATGILATGPLTWWLAQALPDEVPAEQGDYTWRPPELSEWELHGIGIVSLVLFVSGGLVFALGVRSRALQREWLTVVLPLVALAGYAGLTYAAATSPVIGANIGAGLLIMGNLVLVPALGGVSIWSARRLRSQRTHSRTRS